MDSRGGQQTDNASPLAAHLGILRVAFDQLMNDAGGGDLERCTDHDLIRLMVQFEAFRNRLSCFDHLVVNDVRARNLAETMAQGSVPKVLTSVLRISRTEASRRVHAADAVGPRRAMTAEVLQPLRPVLAEAAASGVVGPQHVTVIDQALKQIDRPGVDPAQVEWAEELLTHNATLFGPEDLRAVASRLVEAANPDGNQPDDQMVKDRRRLRLTSRADGMLHVDGLLTPDVGAQLRAVIGPLAKPVPAPPGGAKDERTLDQRQHDALADILGRVLRDGSVQGPGGSPATVFVTIDFDDLMQRTGHGTTSDGTRVPTEDVVKMASEATIVPAFMTSTGALKDLGRDRRLANAAQTHALIVRDGGCSFPNCTRAPEWCERHHIRPWVDGGETKISNLTLLCRYHHHNFVSTGWTCRLNKDGLPEWIPPVWLDADRKPQMNHRIAARITTVTPPTRT